MSDIVDRLRYVCKPGGWAMANQELAEEAANEIERLRAIIANVALAIGHGNSPLLSQ